jgi:hypothetical protein
METLYKRANIPHYQTAREICWPQNFILHPLQGPQNRPAGVCPARRGFLMNTKAPGSNQDVVEEMPRAVAVRVVDIAKTDPHLFR